MGRENYEERHVPGSIDPLVLAALRGATGDGPAGATGEVVAHR
jgi:hypothetical protein